jgi:hypothetical protein
MFAGREKEAAPASKIASIGDIIDGASDVKLGYFSISFIPFIIQ